MTNFEVNPLDVNIVKIQQKFIENTGKNLIEKYQSKDPSKKLFELTVSFKSTLFTVIVEAKAKNISGMEHSEIIFEGSKEKGRKYINSTKFFEDCKKVANFFD